MNVNIKYFSGIFERTEVLSLHWTALDQTAVLLTLILSQIIFYLLLPASLQLLHPAGLHLSLLSSNFITLAAATPILMYKVRRLSKSSFLPYTECGLWSIYSLYGCGDAEQF